ncbi:MAG: transposase [Ignavibacteriales bacterium]|nr:transposase [Ignavibacteriales bacterium]
MKRIRENKHRLAAEIYIGERPIAFTLCLKGRVSYFTNESVFKYFEKVLLEELKHYNCSAFVYLFMPDHLHLVLAGNEPDSNIKKCLEMFKQKTGFYLSKSKANVSWQKDYYDHILRSEENLEIHLKYILNNPVRAGMVNYWKKYPYIGSTVYNLCEWE